MSRLRRSLNQAAILVSLFCSTIVVLGDEPLSGRIAAHQTNAANISAEVAEAAAALNEKFTAHRTAAQDLSENIKRINELIARHAKDSNRENLGRLHLLNAHIYADGLNDDARARVIWTAVVRSLPGTDAARDAKLLLARLDAQSAAKAAAQFPDVKGPLPVLVLRSLTVGSHTFNNVTVTEVATNNISFTHSLGSADANPRALLQR